MTCSIVVDGSESSSPLRSPGRTRYPSRRVRNSIASDFGRYELIVLAISQLSYIPITNTMLSTAFYEPTEHTCAFLNGTSDTAVDSEIFTEIIDIDFNSLLLDWGEACKKSALTAFMSTSLMAGALTGSFIAGWLADTYGRLPVLKGCLLIVCIVNGVFSFVAAASWMLSAAFMFTLGAGCGGYMATRFTQHWFLFHLFTSVMAFVAFLAFQIWVVESCRWLASVHRNAEARSMAIRVMSHRPEVVQKDWQWWEILGFTEPAMPISNEKVLLKKYSYADLFRYSSIYVPLALHSVTV
ncbi:hypothetical protein GCK32_011601, partial [Trichostrongylus colubriformis]